MIRSLNRVADSVAPANEPDGIAPPSAGPIAEPSQDEVAKEAYALFLERGGVHGHDIEDWFRAERILQERRSMAADLGLVDPDL